MRRAFFIVGPTATGKSELAADVASEIGAEIVSADAFQFYRGLDLLTAKPDASTLAKAPHHLIGIAPLNEEMKRRNIAALPRAPLMKSIHAANSRWSSEEAGFTSRRSPTDLHLCLRLIQLCGNN